VDLLNILKKNQKLHMQIVAVTLKVISCGTMSKKRSGSFSHMAAWRSSSKNTEKMSLIPVFNKNLPRAHTESELDVLGVHRKLAKYVVHLSQRKN
jgi:hypothetical protein